MLRSLVICIAITLFCNVECFATEKIIIAGTGDSQKLLRELALAYEKSHPGTMIEVPDSIGSSAGIRSTAAGKVDMGRIARPLKDSEKSYNLNYKIFARSAVVFVVHPSVTKIDNLTSQEIIGIYSGQIKNWSQLGGANHKIYVANREPGDSARTILEGKIPDFKSIKNFAGQVLFTTPETRDTIVKYQYTIGYLSKSMTKETPLRIMKYNGVFPSKENIQNNKYSLTVPLGIIWKSELSGLAKDFLEYLSSTAAQKLILDHGDIPSL